MAGRFSNIQYNDTVNSLYETMSEVLKNPYYKYSDKPPTPAEYFHINTEASTLDEGSKIAYNSVGEDSPFWYNLIHNMMIYGIDSPMSLSYSAEDFGVESSAIEGEAVILPNTIKPLPDDQFIISYLKVEVIFTVTHVEPDTLENGATLYKINYRSYTKTKSDLMKQVIEEYELLIDNVGTNMNPILKSSTADFLRNVDSSIVTLKQLFKRIFYNKRVQTFTYKFLNDNFYDPYLIEFIIRNKLLEGDGEFVYVQHQTKLEPMFPIIYTHTVFNAIEKKDWAHIDSYIHRGVGRLIENKFTIFINRLEEYWEVWYDYPTDYEPLQQIPCFKDVFIAHCASGHTIEANFTFYNIILKYMYDADLLQSDLDELDKIQFDDGPTLYYAIPAIIYCLERYLDKLLVTQDQG